MANVLMVVWFLVGYIVTLSGALIWVTLMLPRPVSRARERIEDSPLRHFFLGLALWAITLVIAAACIGGGRHGGVQLLGWILIGPVLAGSMIGNAAVASILAQRMRALLVRDSPLLTLVGGATCTVLGALVPVVGWFVFTPVVGLIAIGAGTAGILTRGASPVGTPAHPASTEPQPAGRPAEAGAAAGGAPVIHQSTC